MAKGLVLLLSGHGERDPGTVSGDLVERELNIDAVLSVNDYLARTYAVPAGALVVKTYPADQEGRDGEPLLASKIADVNGYGPGALVLELHHNANAGDRDTQVWVSQYADPAKGDESAIAAPIFADELGRVSGQVVPILSSDHSRFGTLGILDQTVGTALLLEIRNLSEATTPEGRYAYAAAIARAIARYEGWALKAPPAPEAPDLRDLVGQLERAVSALDELARELRARTG